WSLCLSQNRQLGPLTVAEIMKRRFSPAVVTNRPWECFHFAGHEIKITEATECYGAIVWPSALVLCHFLETNAKQYSLVDKSVIEIGAGTGLVSIVATLLGAHVTATDLPEVLGNLQYNILKKYQMKFDLEKNFPKSLCHFDYIMAADVCVLPPFLEELLLTFHHLCQDNTVILWHFYNIAGSDLHSGGCVRADQELLLSQQSSVKGTLEWRIEGTQLSISQDCTLGNFTPTK
uniref:Methyltransferase like 21C n=1 Tax=Chelonoidis abingdonii TaxID=106734 RepID=A0A8C0IMS6_CHEAB